MVSSRFARLAASPTSYDLALTRDRARTASSARARPRRYRDTRVHRRTGFTGSKGTKRHSVLYDEGGATSAAAAASAAKDLELAVRLPDRRPAPHTPRQRHPSGSQLPRLWLEKGAPTRTVEKTPQSPSVRTGFDRFDAGRRGTGSTRLVKQTKTLEHTELCASPSPSKGGFQRRN